MGAANQDRQSGTTEVIEVYFNAMRMKRWLLRTGIRVEALSHSSGVPVECVQDAINGRRVKEACHAQALEMVTGEPAVFIPTRVFVAPKSRSRPRPAPAYLSAGQEDGEQELATWPELDLYDIPLAQNVGVADSMSQYASSGLAGNMGTRLTKQPRAA